jgi:SAM-dependent methyltransferase
MSDGRDVTPPAAPNAVTLRPNPILKWIRTHLVERTLRTLPRTGRVLDLGCGYGFYFGINPHARGVDGNPECVAQLRAAGYDVSYCDLTAPLPLGDGSFDWVVAHDVCEHFHYPQLERLFAEVRRILTPGGRFLVFVPNRKGYDYGLRSGAGHVLFVTEREVSRLSEGLFTTERHYPEPLPRWLGRFFTHNKEVFLLRRA